MKRDVMMFVILIALVISGFSYFQLTGKVSDSVGGPEFTGPTQAQISCMETCSSCTYGDAMCMEQHSARCGAECSVETSGPPKPADEGETCMQKCVAVGCDNFDFSCQQMNKAGCEDECNMKGDAPDEGEMGKEQKCISDCVAAVDPTLRCGNSQEGETGGAVCKKCAKACEYLYEGPCLNDEQITQKEKECETCEHCYGKPVEGPSGQGWDCIVDVECGDASDEFGDDAGTGPGIGQEGYVAPNVVAGAVDGIIKFFKGLFGGGGEPEPAEIVE